MADKPMILLFHVEPGKAKQIEAVCLPLKIKVSKIRQSSYGQKLGYLAGITGFHRENTVYAGAEFPTEMLVFSGMDSDFVDTFLEKYKENGIPAVQLKAVITQYNIFWTAEQLYRELYKEHTRFI